MAKMMEYREDAAYCDAGHWLDDVRAHLKRRNQVLFSKDCLFLGDLAELLRMQHHKVVTLWALDLAAETVAQLKLAYPQETRPRQALAAARSWAAGAVKMRPAQRAILDCHAFAKELTDPADIAACHAVGQACAVVHTAGHALGYPMYDLTSIVRRHGIDMCSEAVEARRDTYIEKLAYWSAHVGDYQGAWAAFMER